MLQHIDLERLISAGAVDWQFRELLLRDPLRAAEGYHSDRFHLTAEEKAVIASIDANDYQTLVQVVATWISSKRSDRTRKFTEF
jgi:hypothetical protein